MLLLDGRFALAVEGWDTGGGAVVLRGALHTASAARTRERFGEKGPSMGAFDMSDMTVMVSDTATRTYSPLDTKTADTLNTPRLPTTRLPSVHYLMYCLRTRTRGP